MSVAVLRGEFEQEFDHLMERITDRVDSLGLDEDSTEVKEIVKYWFGDSVLEGYVDWIRK